MALYVDGKNIVQITVDRKNIAAIYTMTVDGVKAIWEAIRSCFGSGMWIRKKPWLRKEGWRRAKRF